MRLSVPTLALSLLFSPSTGFTLLPSLTLSPPPTASSSSPSSSTPTFLHGKKKKNEHAPASSYDKRAQKSSSAPSSAATDKADSEFMFSLHKLTKKVPSTDRTVLQDISLSFYPGAKIGVVGSNGSGKSCLLKIMAGVDKEFEGTARPLPSARIGYLPQEVGLEGRLLFYCFMFMHGV